MKKWVDYIWVWCGAFILNENNELFLMRRNINCNNKAWYRSIPWGGVEYWETLEESVIRETSEEFWINIKVIKQLWVMSDIIPEENQHRISAEFLCEIISWEIINLEPHKCDGMWWFSLENLPDKMSNPTIYWVKVLKELLKNNHETI